MRKKTKQSVDVASVSNAWEALFSSQKTVEKEQLIKDGWLDAHEIADRLKISRSSVIPRMKKVGAEQKKFQVFWGDGKTRIVNFFRLK